MRSLSGKRDTGTRKAGGDKGDKGNNQCPMPNAQCPMPNAQCPMPKSSYGDNRSIFQL
ncbi:hypothetical protein [uncultured Nostoc sp.]|uniref:hypothetical protein n=1 Tax=uncultured Nostoc sp. TaxID=340711 RepID=UPI0035CC966E